jgi:hypothetical protein
MKLGTKMTIGTVVALIVVVAGMNAWQDLGEPTGDPKSDPKPTSSSRSDDNVVLSVTWAPTSMPLHRDVEVLVKVDGVALIVAHRRTSPWGDTAIVAKGAVVTLVANGISSSIQLLDCMIMRNNKVNQNTGHRKRTGPGTVECIDPGTP